MSGITVDMNMEYNTVLYHIPGDYEHYVRYLSGFSYDIVAVLFPLQRARNSAGGN